MAKAIKIFNQYYELVAIVDNATKALAKIEKLSQCSLAEGVTVRKVNAWLKSHNTDIVSNCFGAVFHLEVFEGTGTEIKIEKIALNCQQTAALFN